MIYIKNITTEYALAHIHMSFMEEKWTYIQVIILYCHTPLC